MTNPSALRIAHQTLQSNWFLCGVVERIPLNLTKLTTYERLAFTPGGKNLPKIWASYFLILSQ
jgi:hypothetical protein